MIGSNLLIQHIHAASLPPFRSNKRPRSSSSASRANCIVSAIASLLTRPSHAATISLHVSPLASASKTCQTIMRVPLNVGLPWQISGSATICLPSSTRRADVATPDFTPRFTKQIYKQPNALSTFNVPSLKLRRPQRVPARPLTCRERTTRPRSRRHPANCHREPDLASAD